jgi:hypothetical protein
MVMEKLVEWLAGETEVVGENLPQCLHVHHKPHMLPGREPGPPRWEARSKGTCAQEANPDRKLNSVIPTIREDVPVRVRDELSL